MDHIDVHIGESLGEGEKLQQHNENMAEILQLCSSALLNNNVKRIHYFTTRNNSVKSVLSLKINWI